jgi:hypothetical protein
MVLYAYVCVCAFSLHQESPSRILRDKPLLVQGSSVTVALSKIVDDFVNSCHIQGLSVGSVQVAYVDWCEKMYILCVSGFSYRVYIDSNHRDSQI